ncbi:MAG: ABC transporter ATP-binding protein/permease [Clostridia bacterium]|nr:ABC transporter ATP-binding protein/permease [Clostridia bacterium]
MLELRNVKKIYNTKAEKVHALKGINLKFRESEFVSILGESGCGKTTLLNIIGGLDRYTSGDLIINGKSTKDFKDKDWDAYRNYSIGFIFQSYNLIGHQTILSNVELALTISGVSKNERRKRAIEALEEVGLKDKIHCKPNQLSGGQMQRVAIARALVNNPDIILADEPTGALDSKTSEQVMEILRKISKDKLIIMVTHNGELAEKYSNRIVRILDGKITSDSNPLSDQEVQEAKNNAKQFKKTSMKFITALQLSFNNLLTKKGRTILTSFAGSIGIIGIALILAISTGVQDYINKVERDTLSSYPITIEETTIDMASMMETMVGEQTQNDENREEGKLYSVNIMNDMVHTLSSKVKSNNLKEFKNYIENTDNAIKNNSNAIQYGYNLNLNLYKADTSNGIVQVNPSTVMDSLGAGELMAAEKAEATMIPGMSSMGMMSNVDVWTEMLDNEDLIKSQYDLLAGKWPTNYNEVVLIATKNNEISDYTLYSLGIIDQKELNGQMEKIQKGEQIEKKENTSYSYDELLNLKYKVIYNSDYYQKENGIWIDKSKNEEFIKSKLDEAEEITVVGIIKQNDQTVAVSMSGGIGYKSSLTKHVIEKCNGAEIVKEQKDNPDKNIFSGMEFPKSGENTTFNSSKMTPEQQQALSKMSSEQIAEAMAAYSENANATYEKNLEKMGAIDIDNPATISIYPKDFASKEQIEKGIEEYNKKQTDNGKSENELTYSDMVGSMISSVSTIVDTISYVLIAFVAVSLIVSSIMIGIITYISVLERTKEIGILRAIGVSKKDVSRIFNAETLIIGFIAGAIGIGVTMLLTIPINKIIYNVTGGVEVVTKLPIVAGIILVVISILLTMIGGFIPSKVASKKDPAVVLRSE